MNKHGTCEQPRCNESICKNMIILLLQHAQLLHTCCRWCQSIKLLGVQQMRGNTYLLLHYQHSLPGLVVLSADYSLHNKISSDWMAAGLSIGTYRCCWWCKSLLLGSKLHCRLSLEHWVRCGKMQLWYLVHPRTQEAGSARSSKRLSNSLQTNNRQEVTVKIYNERAIYKTHFSEFGHKFMNFDGLWQHTYTLTVSGMATRTSDRLVCWIACSSDPAWLVPAGWLWITVMHVSLMIAWITVIKFLRTTWWLHSASFVSNNLSWVTPCYTHHRTVSTSSCGAAGACRHAYLYLSVLITYLQSEII